MLEETEKPLRFLQIGDLHVTDAGLQNHLDFRRIIEEINGTRSAECRGMPEAAAIC